MTKISKKYSLLTLLIACCFVFSACSSEEPKVEVSKNSLALIVPESATFFFELTNYDQYLDLISKEKGYAEVMEAFKSNKKLNELFLKQYAPILDIKKEWTDLFIDRNNLVTSFNDLVSKSFGGFVMYSTMEVDLNAETQATPSVTLIFKSADDEFISKIKELVSKSESLVAEKVDDKDIYKSNDADFFVSISDRYIVAASSKDELLAAFANLKTPPAKSILNNTKFQKITAGAPANLMSMYLDFGAFKNLPDTGDLILQNTLMNIESLGFFASFDSATDFDMSFRVAFDKNSLSYNMLAELSLKNGDSIKRAVSNSDVMLSLAIPQLTDSFKKLVDKTPEGQMFLAQLEGNEMADLFVNNFNQLDVSIVDSKLAPAMNMEVGLPKVLVNAYFKDAGKVMNNPMVKGSFEGISSTEKIAGLNVISTAFGPALAQVNSTQISGIFTSDAEGFFKAAQGKGSTLADNPVAKKIMAKASDKNNFFEAYVDIMPILAIQKEILANNLDDLDEEAIMFVAYMMKLNEATYKSGAVSMNMNCKNFILSVNMFFTAEYDFKNLASKINEIK